MQNLRMFTHQDAFGRTQYELIYVPDRIRNAADGTADEDGHDAGHDPATLVQKVAGAVVLFVGGYLFWVFLGALAG